MYLAVPKEGLRAPLFFAFCCLVIGEAADAQSVSRQDLQRCSQLPTAELKLACFEALATPLPDTAPETKSPAVAAAEPAQQQAASAEAPEQRLPGLAASASTGPDAVAVAASATGVPDDPRADNTDVSQEQEPPRDQALVANVSRVVVGDGRRLVFYLDNGEVWRQRKPDYLSYPKNEPFEVEITKGMMGDYRLRVGGEGRMSRIVRVR